MIVSIIKSICENQFIIIIYVSNGQYSSLTPVGEVRVNPHTPHIHSFTDSPLHISPYTYITPL
jgi:hypothetical protein